MEAIYSMSATELNRAEILGRVKEKRLAQTRAAELLGLTERQVRRLLELYRTGGARDLVSKKRGRPSNRAYDANFRARVLGTVRERYFDFGPTLAREKLAEAHGRHRNATHVDD